MPFSNQRKSNPGPLTLRQTRDRLRYKDQLDNLLLGSMKRGSTSSVLLNPKNLKTVERAGLGRQQSAPSELHLLTHSERQSSCRHQIRDAYVLTGVRRRPPPSHLSPCASRNETDKGIRKEMIDAAISTKNQNDPKQWKSRKENPQKLTQLSSISHPRHLVGKRTAQKDITIDTTSDSQV